MRKITGDVTALQRVLTNVKARGTWAEVQLGNILEQTLTKDQYDCNVSTKNDTKRVEFAVKIPSREKDDETVWLPIDSKFPQEDYIRICEAAEKADKEALEAAQKALEQNIKNQAKTIAELYINVPKTTDFAIMFLATEGLYSEVLRRPGLCEEIQNKYRIMICGPTTIGNSCCVSGRYHSGSRIPCHFPVCNEKTCESSKIKCFHKTQTERTDTR